MTNLLHLDASSAPDGESVSRRLTARFAAAWRDVHGDAGYRYRDLAADPLPFVGAGFTTLARRAQRAGVSPDQVAALAEGAGEAREWERSRPLIDELSGAGTLLIGCPMYNLSVPAALKAWIDRVTFPGAFIVPATGESVLADLRVIVVAVRGGAYGPGTPREGFDFQEPYLRAWFTGTLGLRPDQLTFVTAELTRSADIPALAPLKDLAAGSLAAAEDAVDRLATDHPDVHTRMSAPAAVPTAP
jgi:FMN-dependent NADH-azoreductase